MVVFIRTIILYSLVVIVMRVMGKRQIGELQPYELVIAIMLSELASVPMQDTGIPLTHGIIPILTLLLLEIAISLITLKFQSVRRIVCGSASILIMKGIVLEDELRKQRLNLEDLLEDLRMSGYLNFSDIEYAILETSGKLSIIPKASKAPLVREDINKVQSEPSLPINLILDGKLNKENLSKAGYNINWLTQKLNTKNIKSLSDVFIAVLDSSGNLFVQERKNKYDKKS